MKSKVRGNGQGTAYKRGNGWEAQVIVGWKRPTKEGGKPIPIKRRQGGFATKRDAINYCTELIKAKTEKKKSNLFDMYEKWEKAYAPRVSEKTMEGYQQAFAHFKAVHYYDVATITATDLQQCMDACKNGKRTKEVMRTTANLLWKYAIDSGYTEKNVAANLYVGKGASVQREPITPEELELIKGQIGHEPYADYVYCLCYLGFRPSEFLGLKKTDYNEKDKIAYLVGGIKTEAGIDRRVVIPKQIIPIVKERMKVAGTDLIFPMVCHNRKGEFSGYKLMTHNYFNNFCFKPLMEKLGIKDKVPYSARHTYSDKLKHAAGDNKDKAALIGHTDYDFTQHRYQSTTLEDLAKVVETIE